MNPDMLQMKQTQKRFRRFLGSVKSYFVLFSATDSAGMFVSVAFAALSILAYAFNFSIISSIFSRLYAQLNLEIVVKAFSSSSNFSLSNKNYGESGAKKAIQKSDKSRIPVKI